MRKQTGTGDPLSDRQRNFVRAFVRNGANGTQAAITAGYSERGAGVTAHRLLRTPAVLAFLREETERVLNAGIAIGADVLVKLATAAKSESVRLQAATALLDRGGLPLKALTEHRHVIEDRRSDAELLERVNELARELGIGAKKIPLVVDVEAREVSEAEEIDTQSAGQEADDIFN